MLRRKLLIRIGLLVACFVVGAAVAIYLLQNTIPEINRINRDAAILVDGASVIGDCIAQLEDARGLVPALAVPAASAAIPATSETIEARLKQTLASVAEHPALKLAGSPQSESLARLQSLIPGFLRLEAVGPADAHINSIAVHAAVRDLSRALRAHVAREQAAFGHYLRWLVLGLTLAARGMVNVAVFVLLRTAQVVLKPVAQLVSGSRELAAEHFEHRVNVAQQDEFGELARAYNRLAEQLEANEERKVEALRQLAVTLNHDLNNALATIEMQLSLLDRQSGSNSNLARYFRDIQSTLARMGKTVSSLKDIRRIVLMDYVDGQKMVDLEQSVAPPPRRPSEVA
jgi:nitrogen fixation/metabolism regulation signal transduction histidine kinase